MTSKSETAYTYEEELKQSGKEYLAGLKDVHEDIENVILGLSKQGDEADALRSITRKIHSIKGAAGSYGFDLISTVCHRVEDQLSLYSGNPQEYTSKIDFLLSQTDFLKRAIQAYSSENREQLANIRAQLSESTAAETPGGAKPVRILVVDVSRWIGMALASSLKKYPVEIAMCANGYAALGRLLNEHFDVLITSNVIETIDGTTLIRLNQELATANPRARTILLTSNILPELKKAADYCIEKEKGFAEKIVKLLETDLKLKPVPQQIKTSASQYKTLFLVDDSPEIHLLVKMGLKAAPELKTSYFLDGKSALAAFKKNPPDLLLLDLNMPEWDGRQTLQEFRKAGFAGTAIFLTGDTEPSEVQKLLNFGALKVLPKPFSPKNLWKMILS